MLELANRLYEVIKDYRNDDGVHIDPDHIVNWANQFNDDAEFVLNEINHIIPQIYLSKERAKTWIRMHINKVMEDLKYTSISTFLTETHFLNVQAPNKSQTSILNLLNEVLIDNYNLSYFDFKTFPKINYIYFDDILATGGTLGAQIIDWMSKVEHGQITNAQHLLDANKRLIISLFCVHTWGQSFQVFRLKKTFGDKIENNISWYYNYEIQNHVKWNKQSLNIAIPIKEQPPNISTYLASLTAEKYEDYAYRKENSPVNESFFSSQGNRIKYENILMQKGLDIIGMINGPIRANIRPLGLINPNYKTFGLGTHFFTWRNIPNNSPLVFWWEVPGHNWRPLFQVANRGN